MNHLIEFVTRTQSLFLGLALFLSLITATNPEYNLVGPPEALLAAVCFWALMTNGAAWSQVKHLRIICALALGLLILAGCRSIFEVRFTDFPPAWKQCHLMPGLWPKLECHFHLSFEAKPVLRGLFLHSVAGLLCLAVWGLVQTQRGLDRFIMILLGTLNLWLFSGISARLGWADFRIFGDEWLFWDPDYRYSSPLIGNTSWVWPMLWPAWVLAYGLWSRLEFKTRILALVYFLQAGIVILDSNQRGGYTFLVVAAAVFIWSLAAGRRHRMIYAGGLCGLLGLLFFYWQSWAVWLNGKGIFRVKESGFLSLERLEMWQRAWQGILTKPHLGFGVASWRSAFPGFSADRPELIYDTAHNFIVQLIFELGIWHAALIIGFYALIFIWTRKGPEVRLRRRFDGILLPTLVLVLMVQEIDYIRPVYWQAALVLGVYLGLFLPTQTRSEAEEPRWWKVASLSLALLSLVFAVSFVRQFSYGGYAFELSGQGLNRWFRPKGQIVATPTRAHALYTALESKNLSLKALELTPPYSKIESERWLILENGSKYWAKTYRYQALLKQRENGRLLGMGFEFPAKQTNLLFTEQEGLGPYLKAEHFEQRSGRLCAKSGCRFTLKRRTDCQKEQILYLEKADADSVVLREGSRILHWDTPGQQTISLTDQDFALGIEGGEVYIADLLCGPKI